MIEEIIERTIVRHIATAKAKQAPAHVLFPAAYYRRWAAIVIEHHFPALEFSGPVDELPCEEHGETTELVQSFCPVMVGSLSGMCMVYLRAKLKAPEQAARFEQADALVFNYDENEMGSMPMLHWRRSGESHDFDAH